MTEETRAKAIEANKEQYHRVMQLFQGAIITAFAAGILFAVAVKAEEQQKARDVAMQEASATWKR